MMPAKLTAPSTMRSSAIPTPLEVNKWWAAGIPAAIITVGLLSQYKGTEKENAKLRGILDELSEQTKKINQEKIASKEAEVAEAKTKKEEETRCDARYDSLVAEIQDAKDRGQDLTLEVHVDDKGNIRCTSDKFNKLYIPQPKYQTLVTGKKYLISSLKVEEMTDPNNPEKKSWGVRFKKRTRLGKGTLEEFPEKEKKLEESAEDNQGLEEFSSDK